MTYRILKKKNGPALLKPVAGFTLLELLVVMTIIGILSVILFRTFATVSELTFRVEQEKNVTQEIISFSQILQNYADRNQIDYEKYSRMAKGKSGTDPFSIIPYPLNVTDLQTAKGLTTVLYLSGQDGHVAFYSSGDCIQPGEPRRFVVSGAQELQCAFYLEKDGQIIEITNPKKTYISQVIFKIIPFASQEQYLNSTPNGSGQAGTDGDETLIYSLNKPGFWIFTQVRNARYSPTTRGNNVEIPVQQFFNLK